MKSFNRIKSPSLPSPAPKRKRKCDIVMALSAAALAGLNFFASHPASAANGTDTWASASSDTTGNWSVTANWAPGSANNPPISGDLLSFGATSGVTTLNNDLSFTSASNISSPASYSDLFDGITFSGSSAYTLDGNSVTLGAPTESNNGTFTGSIVNNSSLTQDINLATTFTLGLNTISNSSTGTIDLSQAVTTQTGSMINFTPDSGTINVSGSGLAIDSTGILGGWAIDGASFATLSGSNIAAYNSATSESGNFTTTVGTNFKITAGGGTLGITQASGGTDVDLNTIQWTGTSNETVIAKNSPFTIRVGPDGAIMNANGGSKTLTIGNNANATFLTAGGNTTNNPGTIYLYDLASNGAVETGNGNLVMNIRIANNGTGAVTVVQDGSVNYNSTANTFSGGIYINDGDAYVDPSSNTSTTPLGTGNITVSPGGRLDFGGDNGAKIGSNIYIAGFGSNLNGASPGGGNPNAGAIKLPYQGSLTGTITLMGNASIDPNNGGNSTLPTITGQVTGTGSLMVGGSAASGFTAGTVAMSGIQNYTGDLIIDNETNNGNGMSAKLTASNTLENSGNVDVVGGSSGVATLDLDGSTQSINGLSSTNSLTNVVGGTADSIVTSSAAGASLTLGNSNATATFGGVISGSIAITKTGAGTETFGGTDTYTGNTNITGGTLSITGSVGTSSSIAVGNATTLTGSGTVGGNVSVSVGGILTGGIGGGGTLTLNGSTTVNGASTFNVQANGSSTSANSITAATLSPSATTNSITVNVGVTGSALVQGGVYDLIGYTGSLSGAGFSAFTLGTQPVRVVGSLQNGTGEIQYAVTSLDFPVWTGALDGNWTTSGSVTTGGAPASSDWVLNSNNASGTDFVTGDTPLFNDLASVITVNISAGNVSPGAVTFNNNNNNYTIGSTGGYGIAAGSISKSGTGSLTINSSNTYAGGTTLNAGTLNIGNAAALGSGTLTISGGAIDNSSGGSLTVANNIPQTWANSFTFVGSNPLNLGAGAVSDNAAPTITLSNTSNALTVGGAISGSGSLTTSGVGILLLNGANTFNGGLTIGGSSTVEVPAVGGGSTGLGAGNVTVNAGATLIGAGSDSFGYYPNAAPNTIFINGGTVTDQASTTGYRITSPNFNFTGGTLTSNSGNSGNGGDYSLFGASTITGALVTTNATTSTAVINATAISLQNDNKSNLNTIFTVAGGVGTTLSDPNVTTGTPGVDLLISSNITPFQTQTDGITLSGSGVMALTGTNTYNGNTTISSGTLQIGTGGSTGTLGTGAVIDNSNLVFDRSDNALNVSNSISGSGAVYHITSGTVTLSGNSSYSGGTNVTNGGTLIAANPNALGGVTSVLTLSPSATLDIQTNSSISAYNTVVSGNVTLDSDRLTAGAGITQTLGNLSISTSNSNGTNGVVATIQPGVNVTSGTAVLAFGSVTLTGSSTGIATFSPTPNGTANTAVTMTSVTGSATAGQVATLDLNGNSTGNTVSGSISDGTSGGQVALVKRNTGTWILSGNSSYSGGTIINNGTLVVSGGFNAGSTFDIRSGTLAGTTPAGLSLGNVYLDNGNGQNNSTINVGNNSVGTLNMASLAVSTGTLIYTLGAGNASSTIAVSGAANFSGSSTIIVSNANPAVGTYTLLTSTSSLVGQTEPTAPTSPLPYINYSLDFGNSNPDDIFLDVTFSAPSLTWDGHVNNTWDMATGNWNNGNNPASVYADPDEVNFDDTAPSTATNIALNISVAPTLVTVNSNTNNYTISGSGSINDGTSGPTLLNKLGSSTLTIATNNGYTGGTIIGGGTVQIGNGGSVGNLGTGTITDSGVLAIDLGSTYAIPNNIVGSGAVSQIGSGTTIFTTNYTYTGPTLISAGTLQLGNGGGTGSLGTGTVTDNATLAIDLGNTTFSIAVGGSGNLSQVGTGTLILTGGNTYSGVTTIATGSTIQVGVGGSVGSVGPSSVSDNGALNLDRSDTALIISGVVSGSGTVNQISSGGTTLSGNNTYTGGTNISAGTLTITNDSSLGADPVSATPGNVVINGGATLNVLSSGTSINSSRGITLNDAVANSNSTINMGGQTLTYGGILSDGANIGNLFVSGGTLHLTGNSTYSGNTIVSNGTLQFGAGTNIIAANTITTAGQGLVTDTGAVVELGDSNGASFQTIPVLNSHGTSSIVGGSSGTPSVLTINYAGAGDTYSQTIGGAGTNQNNLGLAFIGSGTFKLNGVNNSYTGGTTINNAAGILIASQTSAMGGVSSNITLDAGTLDLQMAASPRAYSVTIPSSTNSTPPTTTIEPDVNTAGAGLTETLGALSLGNDANNGTNGILFNIQPGSLVSSGTATLGFGAVTLTGTSTGISTFDPVSGTVNVAVTMTNVTGSAAASNTDTLDLNGTSTGNVISGVISDGSGGGNVAVVKRNTGTWSLSGNSSYGGGTIINNGTLIVNGGLNLSGSLNIHGGTLAGVTPAGQSLGNVTMDTANVSNSTISPGNSTNSLGTLNMASLNVSAGTLQYALGYANASSSIAVSGAANFTGGTITLSNNAPSAGTYTLLTSSSNLSSMAGSVSFTPPASSFVTYSLDFGDSLGDGANPDDVFLEVQFIAPSLTWSGATNNTWDMATGNWNNGSISNAAYTDPDEVVFNDTAPTTATNIALNVTVSPNSVTFNNNTNNYSISGTGSISGSAALFKMGTASLTINTANSYTGGTILSGGVLTTGSTGTLGNGTVTISAGTLNIGNAVALGNGAININGGAIDNTSTGSLTLSGNNTLAINNSFTFNGTNPLNLGTGAVSLNNSDSITVNNNALTIGGVISGTSSLSTAGNGTLILTSGNNTFTGGLIVGGASTVEVSTVGGGKTGLGSGNVTVNAGATLIGTNADAFGYFPNAAPSTIFINGGTVTDLASTTGYRITSPNFNFTGGTLTSNSGNSGNGGDYSLFGNTPGGGAVVTTNATSSTAVINATAISLQNNNTSNVNTIFNIAGGAGTTLSDPNVTTGTPGVDLLISSNITPFQTQTDGITLSGSGVMALTGTNTYNGNTTISSGTLRIGAGGSTGTLGTGIVIDNSNLVFNRSDAGLSVGNTISGSGAVYQNGAGTTTLSGTDTYSGGTVINRGTLSLSGSLNSAGTVTVNSGGTLTGSTSVASAAGNVTVNSGGIVTPGIGVSTNETLNLANLTVSGGELLYSDLGANNASSLLAVSGNANFTGGSISIAAVVAGSFLLLTAGSLSGAAPTVSAPAGFSSDELFNQPSDPNDIVLILSNGPTNLTWDGQADNTTWDIATTANWNNGSIPSSTYVDGSNVTFDDTAPTTATVISLNTTVNPLSMTVNSNINSYTFAGTGSIAGSTSLIKSGGSALIVAMTNSYTGGTTINAGTIQIGDGGSLGSLGSGNVTDNSSLVFNRSDAGFTFANNISGSGTVTQSGTGTTTLTGSNSYSGNTTVSAGTLVIGGTSALPSGGNVINNAAFDVSANSVAGNVSGTGTTTVAANTTLTTGAFSQAGGLVNNGTTTILGNGTVGPISGSGGLVIGNGSTSNTLTVHQPSGVNTQSALTINNGAELNMGNNELTLNTTTAGALQIGSTGTLNLNGEMLINYAPGQDPVTTIRGYLASGFNGGSWNGPGIISTDAQTLTNGLSYALGFADYASEPVTGFVAGLSSGQIEVKYTLVGDLNLNGFVDGVDFSILGHNFNKFDTNWTDGNMLYHSLINGQDFSVFAKNFGRTAVGGSITLSAADWAAFDAFEANEGVAVPEPTSMGLLALAGAGLMARRRRKS